MKTWTIATDDPYLHAKFRDKLCAGKDIHPVHTPVAGKYTKLTEDYIDPVVRLIHKGWKSSLLHRNRSKLGVIEIPSMPVIPTYVNGHRPRILAYMDVFDAMVVRTVKRKEMLSTPAAVKAMDDEWNKLSKQIVWDLNTAREQDEVVAQARSNNTEVHFGDIFGICGVKGSELQEGDPAKKWKGRFVFRGSDVKDGYNDTAVFNGLSSSPATLGASKAVDAYGLIDGHTSSQCDAEQAYVQSNLGGTETLVRIPKDRWPAERAGRFRKPVVLLKLALYGRSDAGGYWESHCKERLVARGFTPVHDWNGMYWHSRLKLLFMVYVDDFKMSGPTENMNRGWEFIRTSIKTGEPSPPGKCLGCNHVIKEISINGNKIRQMVYDMGQFMVQCVEPYLTAANTSRDFLKYVCSNSIPGRRQTS